MEKGLNRFKPSQIKEDDNNQTKAMNDLMEFLDVEIQEQPILSFWDWEFFRDGKLLAIGEYRRRFCKFGTFEDFQFSKKKFKIMMDQGSKLKIPAYMFVQFDNTFVYFEIKGNPPTKMMRRNHEVRTEECVCISNDNFINVINLKLELI
jgi:hypothetical protein